MIWLEERINKWLIYFEEEVMYYKEVKAVGMSIEMMLRFIFIFKRKALTNIAGFNDNGVGRGKETFCSE